MRDLNISCGNSRQDKKWQQRTISYDELKARLQTPIRTAERAADYAQMPKPQRDAIKDHGGFVAGRLNGPRRTVKAVIDRSMVALDGDDVPADFLDDIENKLPFAALIYSTHSHTPEKPRIRILYPLTRDVSPDEHAAIARHLADSLGIEYFDVCSYRANQLMYWPSAPADGEFLFKDIDHDWLDPDTYLARYPDWQDISTLPIAKREAQLVRRSQKRQKDPLEKKGIIGAFNHVFYPISRLLETELSDVYEATAVEDRYTHIGSTTAGGAVVYEDKFLYSHHATDPACGKLLNAFDLMRIHRFGDLDDQASIREMREYAGSMEAVKLKLLEERSDMPPEFADADDEDNWRTELRFDSTGDLENCLHNLILILNHDPNLQHIVFNQLADGMEIKGAVPWKHIARFWRDADDAQLTCYIDAHYGSFSERNYNIAVTKVVDDRSYHPIREFFESLPEWDGVSRVDTLLIDYLGAEDNAYTRAVTRKTICAAIARIRNPGIKFDNILVLNGTQGIGKSTLIAKLGGEWYSDSLSLTDMNDKTAAEKLQGYWIMEIGELAGMKKADVDRVKAFISRQDDKYRASFGRRVTPHPRQCIFFGTTNSQNGFLRDITGNRRFWTVKVPGSRDLKPWNITTEDVRQVWAEAIVLYERGEKLYLDAVLEQKAQDEQMSALEQDDREGIVREYLEKLLPENWADMDIYERREYVSEPNNPTQPKGTVRRETVSNMEIWCECFGKKKEELRGADSYAIAAIMMRIGGWSKPDASIRISLYGKQRVYKRN